LHSLDLSSSLRNIRIVIADLFRFQLDLRREWLALTGEPNGKSFDFNDADLALIGLLQHAFDAWHIVVFDQDLGDVLQDAHAAVDAKARTAVCRTIDDVPAQTRSILLVSRAHLHSQAVRAQAHRADCLVLVYGWTKAWSPQHKGLSDWPSDLVFLSSAGLGPALWRCGTQVLTSAHHEPATAKMMASIQIRLNDGDLDVCTLLDCIQTLETKIRKKAVMRQSVEQPSDKKDTLILSLRREVDELRRTIGILQHGLAFAHVELGKPALRS